MLSVEAQTHDSSEMPTDEAPLVSIVIPCLNEEKTLPKVLVRAREALQKYGYSGEIIVADNGSTDTSRQIAASMNARVVPVAEKGYGSALIGGFEAARGRLIIMGDADDTYDFMEINRFVEKIDSHDFIMGTRLKGDIEAGAMPDLHRYLGTPVLTTLINWFFRANISDCNCGLRGFSKEAYERLDLHSTGMELASEMIIKACLIKLRVTEVPVSLRIDRRGRRPHLRPWSDGWRHLRFILAYASTNLLMAPGLAMVSLGTALFACLMGGPVTFANGLVMDYHFLFPAALALILGAQLICFALVTRTYTGLSKYTAGLPGLRKRINVETAMILGCVLMIVGLAINVAIVVEWLKTYSKGLFAVRPAIFALTLMAVGAQICINSFLIGVLNIPQTKRVVEPSDRS